MTVVAVEGLLNTAFETTIETPLCLFIKCLITKPKIFCSTADQGFGIKKPHLVLLFIPHSPHLELVGAVTVETLELLLPPKVCLSAP